MFLKQRERRVAAAVNAVSIAIGCPCFAYHEVRSHRYLSPRVALAVKSPSKSAFVVGGKRAVRLGY
jgi:hypothetical protein